MRRLNTWLKASRLPSQSYIALPLLLGQAWAWRERGALSWGVFFLVQLFGLFDQLFIVWANDYADRETDTLNQSATAFSGGSRVLIDGDLVPPELARAALLAAAASLGIGLTLALGFERPWAVALAGAALLLLWAYSYPPLRLSYRGGGELLQMLGVGGLLPLLGYYSQTGDFAGFPWPALAVLLPVHLGCAIATALPDEPSDRASAKRTIVVLLGPLAARMVIVALGLASAAAFALGGACFTTDAHPALIGLLLALPMAATVAQLGLWRSRPGSTAVKVHVFLGILATSSLVVALGIVALLD